MFESLVKVLGFIFIVAINIVIKRRFQIYILNDLTKKYTQYIIIYEHKVVLFIVETK